MATDTVGQGSASPKVFHKLFNDSGEWTLFLQLIHIMHRKALCYML